MNNDGLINRERTLLRDFLGKVGCGKAVKLMDGKTLVVAIAHLVLFTANLGRADETEQLWFDSRARVEVERGATPSMNEREVAQLARQRLTLTQPERGSNQNHHVLSLQCYRADESLLPMASRDADGRLGFVWNVRFEGPVEALVPFATGPKRMVYPRGFVIIDDLSGNILARGFGSLPPPVALANATVRQEGSRQPSREEANPPIPVLEASSNEPIRPKEGMPDEVLHNPPERAR